MAAEAGGRGTLYYVYALADAGLPRRFACGRRTLRSIDIRGVSVVAETVREPRATTEQALREQHAIVARLARRVQALLPVRFGAVFTPAELDARVKSEHDVLRDALDRVRGHVQMTVRLQSDTAGSLQPARVSSGTAYLAARSGRDRALRRHAGRIRRAVSGLVADQRLDPGKSGLQGTVYHLIRSTDVERYRAALDAVAPSLAPVRLMVTGPWPVFAFVPALGRGTRG